MSDVPASLVKQLRDQTGAGMMDCKRALQETGGDLSAAKKLLRERGQASAAKKAESPTNDGLVAYIASNGAGSIVGIGSQSDFVAKNKEFQSFAEKVLQAVHAEGENAVAALESERKELIAKLGENIVIVDAAHFDVSNGHVVQGYAHPPANKIGVLVELDGGSETLARQLAMHISFAAPEWATREEVPADVVDAEREIFMNSDEVQSKPEPAREKIVDGMLGKRFYAATPGGVLADQAWIHEPSKTVAQALEEAGASVVRFKRISVAGS